MYARESPELIRAVAEDVTAFPRRVFGETPTEDQMAFLLSVRNFPRTLALGGNSTGKTRASSYAALEWLLPRLEEDPRDYSAGVMLVSNNFQQLKQTLWRSIRSLWAQGARRGFPIGDQAALKHDRITLAEDVGAECVSTKDEVSFGGRHNKRMLIILDECLDMASTVWDASEGMLANPRCRLVASLNPLEAYGEALRASRDTEHWHEVNFSCLRHPNVVQRKEVIPGACTAEYVDQMRSKYGEDHPQWVSRVKGEFPVGAGDKIIPLQYLEACAEITPTEGDGTHIGVDVALGNDKCVAVVVKDRVLKRIVRWRSHNAGTTLERIKEVQKEEDASWENVHVDSTAMGAVMVSNLRDQGCDCDGVNFGSAKFSSAWRELVGKVRARNVRAYLFWVARRLFEERQLCIPRTDEFREVWEDLAEPSWHPNPQGVTVEEKKRVMRRLGRSPDCGDALIISLNRRFVSSVPLAMFA